MLPSCLFADHAYWRCISHVVPRSCRDALVGIISTRPPLSGQGFRACTCRSYDHADKRLIFRGIHIPRPERSGTRRAPKILVTDARSPLCSRSNA